jgi:hypothetical protein
MWNSDRCAVVRAATSEMNCDLYMPALMADVVYGADVLDVVGVAEERCTRNHRVTKVVRCFAFRGECSTAMTRATEGSSEGGGGTRNGKERGDDMQKGRKANGVRDSQVCESIM